MKKWITGSFGAIVVAAIVSSFSDIVRYIKMRNM